MNIYNDIITSKQKVKTIILILTHSCNLKCTYCYERNKGFSEIDIDVAKHIIEREMMSPDDLDREIEFFGGEVKLELSLFLFVLFIFDLLFFLSLSIEGKFIFF